VRSAGLSPAIDLSYAVFGGGLVISTSPLGVEQAIRGGGDLATTEPYRTALGVGTGGVSALVFLNLEQLIRLAEPRGLAEIASGFSADLARLKALSLSVRSSSESLDTTVFLEIK
jgi:hypothetical protein